MSLVLPLRLLKQRPPKKPEFPEKSQAGEREKSKTWFQSEEVPLRKRFCTAFNLLCGSPDKDGQGHTVTVDLLR